MTPTTEEQRADFQSWLDEPYGPYSTRREWLTDEGIKVASAAWQGATEAAARRSPPPAAEGAWKPIETAPKDGTMILLGRAEDLENDRGAISTPGRWHDEDHDGPDNMGHDAGFMDDEFQQFSWGRSFGNPIHMSAGFQPTHWMPLPPPPAITKAGKKEEGK